MFGYLAGPSNDRSYRQLYAWCCSSQRDWLGARSLAFISYESIFACALSVDLDLIQPPPIDSVTCCKARRRHSSFRRVESPENQAVAKFNAALAMLLAKIKLEDDVRDSSSLAARGLLRFFRKPIEESCRYFNEIDSQFDEIVRGFLADHSRLEERSSGHPLDQYVMPTGKAFGYVYSLLPRAIELNSQATSPAEARSVFQEAGRLLGESLIAFDCAVDFERDRQSGHYNPLSHRGEVVSAMEFAQRRLVQLGWALQDTGLPPRESSIASRILRHRIQTLADRRAQLATLQPQSRPPSRRLSLPAFSLVPAKQRRGDCDCVGEICCEGIGHCGEIANCCDMSCCCDPCFSSPRKKKKSDKASKPIAERSKTGIVRSALTPYGTICLDGDKSGREVAAKSESGVIDSGQRVRVIRKVAFGLLVRSEGS